MKKLLIITASLFFVAPLFAQFGLSDYSNQWSYDLVAGTTNYNGDLTQKTGPFTRLSYCVGANLKYRIPTASEIEKFEIRLGMSFGRISGDDSKNADPELKARGLNFKSNIFEMNLGCEYTILDMISEEGGFISPYVYAGIGFFHFNPFTYDNNNNKVYLQPLCTEGQGYVPGVKKYKLTQFQIPLAVGVKVDIGNYIDALDGWTLSYEMMYHHTFTDYLDDVSKRYVSKDLLDQINPKSYELAYRSIKMPGYRQTTPGDIRGNLSKRDVFFYNTIKMNKTLDWSQISIADWFR